MQPDPRWAVGQQQPLGAPGRRWRKQRGRRRQQQLQQRRRGGATCSSHAVPGGALRHAHRVGASPGRQAQEDVSEGAASCATVVCPSELGSIGAGLTADAFLQWVPRCGWRRRCRPRGRRRYFGGVVRVAGGGGGCRGVAADWGAPRCIDGGDLELCRSSHEGRRGVGCLPGLPAGVAVPCSLGPAALGPGVGAVVLAAAQEPRPVGLLPLGRRAHEAEVSKRPFRSPPSPDGSHGPGARGGRAERHRGRYTSATTTCHRGPIGRGVQALAALLHSSAGAFDLQHRGLSHGLPLRGLARRQLGGLWLR
mmetsp:Transcript_31451/g.80836  ORF Transcript_31451/g.80836 Transcript_31451/m.80836 type:complete len:308 (+) Transcript_31451:466-1389(+)